MTEDEMAEAYKRADGLKQLWTDAEAKLRLLRVPVDVWLPNQAATQVGQLGFAKHYVRGGKTKWRILWREPSTDLRTGDWIPHENWSLDQRIERVKLFPVLRQAVIDECKKTIAKIDGALAQFDKILNAE